MLLTLILIGIESLWICENDLAHAHVSKKLVPISRMNYTHMMYDFKVEITKSYTPYDIDAIITETYNLVTAANLIIIKTNQV